MPEILLISVSVFVFLLFLVAVLFYIKKSKDFSNFKKQYEEEKVQTNDFMAVVIHDLRSPLTVIRGSSDLLIKDSKDISPDQAVSMLEQIRNSSTWMLGIVNNLLDLAKIEAGKIELAMKMDDINQLVTDVYNYYLTLAKDRGLNIVLDLDSSVPHLNFDNNKLRQVLNNLMSNALKFTEYGENIFLFTRKEKDSIEVIVADTGKGIPDDQKEYLFNKFVQVKQNSERKDKEKGSGLGLAISKGVIEAHGGKIWVENNKPKGTKFTFSIPIAHENK